MVDVLHFHDGETIAAEIIHDIHSQSSQILHDKYLVDRSFAYSAKVSTDALAAHVRMCFVSHEADPHFSDDNWTEEALPPKIIMDSWARKTVATLGHSESRMDKKSPTSKRMSAIPSPAARGERKKEPEKEKSKREVETPKEDKDRKTKIICEVVRDDEETRFRELKQIEERRLEEEKRKIEAELRKKEAKKAELLAIQEEMEKRPHTFDSDGNLIWITPPNIPKMPKMSHELPYKFKRTPTPLESKDIKSKDEDRKESRGSVRPTKGGKAKAASRPIKPARKFDQFTDTFTTLTSEQPPIIDTLLCQAGVILGAYGRQKKGPNPTDPSHQMSRLSYEGIVKSDTDFHGEIKKEEQDEPAPEWKEPEVPDELPPVKVKVTDFPKGSGKIHAFNVALAQDPNWGTNRPTDQPKRTHTSAPLTTKNWSMKRNAVGNLGRLPRHHSAMLGTGYGGFSRCLPQPVMGATMGHGLAAMDDFFFPPNDRLPKKEIPRVQKTQYQSYMARSSTDFRELDMKLARLNRRARLVDGAIKSEERGRLLVQSAVD
eukprot:GEMP01019662.1.p1 GENE.GEMP01019662.1~~GEMP01019662.1.p1  ORF type:complete len:552 (+),score=112.44 GEMP01019662.1:25-1656(+)